MKNLILIVLLLLLMPLSGFSAGGKIHLDSANIDPSNEASLQRGLKYFANYCLSCHSAGYSRYNRVGVDLGVPESMLSEQVIFTRDADGEKTKPGALMEAAITKRFGNKAFGTPPPDLTLVVRSRSVDWLYTYLRGFYLDDSRPFGVNNKAFPDVGMPHVMWELQGWQAKKVSHEESASDHGHGASIDLELVKPGQQTPAEFDRAVRDLVNFMAYLAEPAKSTRQNIGIFVMLFLSVFLVLSYLLKKEYWKDIH